MQLPSSQKLVICIGSFNLNVPGYSRISSKEYNCGWKGNEKCVSLFYDPIGDTYIMGFKDNGDPFSSKTIYYNDVFGIRFSSDTFIISSYKYGGNKVDILNNYKISTCSMLTGYNDLYFILLTVGIGIFFLTKITTCVIYKYKSCRHIEYKQINADVNV